MQNEKYWNSKIPVKLAALFLLNVALIIALEVLLLYRFPSPLDEAALAQANPDYIGCRVLSQDSRNSLHFYVVQTANGETELLPAKQHGLFYGRARLLDSKAVALSGLAEETVHVRIGIHTATVHVLNGSTLQRIEYTSSIRETTTFYMVLGAILEGLELALLHILKRS